MPAASTSAQRVAKRRAAFRAQRLRPIRIRAPDTRAPGFAEECARQAAIADNANRAAPELGRLEEAAPADIAEPIDALEAGHRAGVRAQDEGARSCDRQRQMRRGQP